MNDLNLSAGADGINANKNVIISPSSGGYTNFSSGNVGIGTTSPSALLSVNGSGIFGVNTPSAVASPVNVSFGGTYGINSPGSQGNLKWDMYNASGSNRYGIGMSAGLMEFQAGSNNDGNFAWYTGSAIERMRLTTAGNVGIGTTGPNFKLDVNGTANFAGHTTPDADNAYTLGSSSRRWSTIYTQNALDTPSDERLKEDIETSPLGLTFVRSLRPVAYRWKSGGDKSLHYGLLAQDLEEVLGGQEFAGLKYDDKNDLYSVAYTELISPLIRSIQELAQEKDELKITVEALKALVCKDHAQAEVCSRTTSR